MKKISLNDYLKIQPIPSWVINNEIPKEDDEFTNQFTDSVFLLNSNQVNFIDKKNTHTNQIAIKIKSKNGVYYFNNIEFSFEYLYEKIVFHYIQIIRNGKIIDILKKDNFTFFKEKTDASSNIITDLYKINYTIDGLQVNDILHYCYSYEGASPYYRKGLLSYIWQLSHPCQKIYKRVIWPKNQPLYKKNNKDIFYYTDQENVDHRELVFSTQNSESYTANDYEPSWFNPYPTLFFSNQKDWKNIVKEKLNNFIIPDKISKNLENYINALKEKHLSSENQITEALNFVSNEISYIATHEYLPQDPSKLFETRRGDCKDKSILLLTILNKLNITAYCALVNTYMKHTINEHLPVYNIFNHIAIIVYLNDSIYLLDATIQDQGKNLNSICCLDLGYCLVLKNETKELASLPVPLAEKSKIKVKEIYDYTDFNNVKLKIETIYYGHEAIDMRSFLTNQSSDIKKRHHTFAKYFYEDAELIDFNVEDNIQLNEIICIEEYNLFHHFRSNDQIVSTFIYFMNCNEFLDKFPTDWNPQSPFTTHRICSVEMTQHIILPINWKIDKFHTSVKNPHFILEKTVTQPTKREITIDYTYKNFRSYVLPEDYEQYKQDKILCKDNLGYLLDFPSHKIYPLSFFKRYEGFIKNTLLYLFMFIFISILRKGFIYKLIFETFNLRTLVNF